MPGLSDYAEAACLNALLRGIAPSVPNVSALRLALFTADPTDAGLATEVTGSWYARQPTQSWSAPAPAGASQACTNQSAVTFNSVSGAAVTITHVGVYDASTGGNMLFYNAMPSPKTLQIGDVLSFAVGSLVASLD